MTSEGFSKATIAMNEEWMRRIEASLRPGGGGASIEIDDEREIQSLVVRVRDLERQVHDVTEELLATVKIYSDAIDENLRLLKLIRSSS